jgi:glutamine cyclotransferase
MEDIRAKLKGYHKHLRNDAFFKTIYTQGLKINRLTKIEDGSGEYLVEEIKESDLEGVEIEVFKKT